jgi:oxazoline/thiazoline dehydrogenase
MNRYCVQIDPRHSVQIPEPLEILTAELEQGICTEDELAELLLAKSDEEQLPWVYYFLGELRKKAALKYLVYADGALLAVIEPLNGTFRLSEEPTTSTRLSRFAYLRHTPSFGRESGVDEAAGSVSSAILDCPESGAQIRLEPRAAVELAEAMITGTVGQGPLFDLLNAAGYLEPEQEPLDRAVWEFHDLLFHSTTRIGRPWHSIGATWRFEDRLLPPPLRKPPMSEEAIPLPEPAAEDRVQNFNDVLERRRSIRSSDKTITVQQLATLLYRVFRIKETSVEGRVETAHRTFPSGGGIHELECYVWIRECAGAAAGLYHYQADEHILYRLECEEDQKDAVFSFARSAWGWNYPAPQVLLTLAARFPRIAIKYERMAYRAVLLNAGCAMQTVYLTATAMGLAVCGLGNGAPQILADAARLAPFEETSVAEIALSGEI